jgi:gliding motility-associated lipoprotein GldD
MGKSSKITVLFSLGLGLISFFGCTEKAPVPKPRVYLKLDLPEHSYSKTEINHPCFSYQFDLGKPYVVGQYVLNQARPFFYFNQRKLTQFNARQIIDLGPFTGRIELFSFVFPTRDSLSKLIEFSNDLVDEDKIKADSISFERYVDPKHRVFGTVYSLKGNVANNFRFHLTDSTRRFLMGYLMLECPPNYDSLRPSLDYLKVDLDRMIESFRWKD